MDTSTYHIPALLEPTVDALNIQANGVYADATFGGGGHSRAIMNRLGMNGHLYGFDRDLDAKINSIDDSRFTFVHGDFRYMENYLRFDGVKQVDGIVADLGVSFHHFDDATRGFSFRTDSPLDMRMNRHGGITAAELLNTKSEKELMEMLSMHTDLKRPGAIAKAIINYRTKNEILTTGNLADAVSGLMNPKKEKKDLAQVFQALRISVNGEMDALKRFLLSTLQILKPGGRLAVLTYHSGEDRLVKNFLRSGNLDGKITQDFYGKIETPWKPVIKGALAPTEEEINYNPRARSAKLRAAERI